MTSDLKYEEARSLLAKRKWAEAAIVLRSIVKDDPTDLPAAMDLARALVYTGRREEAVSLLGQTASRMRGPRKEAILKRARVVSRMFLTNATFQTYQDGLNYLRAKKTRNARERFESALAQEPDNVEVLVRDAQCLLLEGDYDSAAERLRLARKLNPVEPEIHLWLGRALQSRGELSESVDELRIAQKELKSSELAPLWLADALASSGQRMAAIQVLENNVKAKPFHLAALLSLAKIRFSAALRERQALWAVRKDLQLANSRFDQYASAKAGISEGELGLDLRDPAELKEGIAKLLDKVDSALAKTEENDT